MSPSRVLLVFLLACAAAGCDPVPAAPTPVDDKGSAGSPVRGLVTYAGDVRVLPETSVVYVFARRPGQTMPLAVERFEPSALPRTVEFERRDSEVPDVELVARLSLTGDVYQQPGDSEVVSGALAFDGPVTVALALPVIDAGSLNGSGPGPARVDWRAEAAALGDDSASP